MIQLCNNKVPCFPCPDDSPILNLSAELPDAPLILGTFDWADPPPIGSVYSSRGCYSWCFSKVSQQDADDCARRNAQLCAWTDGGGPTPGCGGNSGLCSPVIGDGYQLRTNYFNSPQTCSILCPDGSLFIDTVPAGTILSVMSQADADERAASLCQKRIKSRMLCWLTTSLPDGKQNTLYSPVQLRVSGGVHPYTFSLLAGSLPDGLSLSSTGVISGTPTGSGLSTFTAKVVDANNPSASSQRSFTINVIAATGCVLPVGTDWVYTGNGTGLIDDGHIFTTHSGGATSGFYKLTLTWGPTNGQIHFTFPLANNSSFNSAHIDPNGYSSVEIKVNGTRMRFAESASDGTGGGCNLVFFTLANLDVPLTSATVIEIILTWRNIFAPSSSCVQGVDFFIGWQPVCL